jgi:hypothetical protein
MSSLPSFRSHSRRINESSSRSTPSKESLPQSRPYEYSHCDHVYLSFLTALLHLTSLVFIILVIIGNIRDRFVLRSTYFLKIDLSHIVPRSVPNAVLINSIARTIGLHDFYQVGLWNFCEGYAGQGITGCSKPVKLYWFNPIEILLNELLAGATIVLPADITDTLKIVKVVSHWMFGLFIVGAPLCFLCVLLSPFSASGWPRDQKRRKWYLLRNLPLTILTFLAALTTLVACVIATVMFVIFRNVFTNGDVGVDLNIGAELGTQMLAFMWIAAGTALFGFLIQIGMCCGACCKCCGAGRSKNAGKRSVENESNPGEKEGNGAVKRRMGWRSRRVDV